MKNILLLFTALTIAGFVSCNRNQAITNDFAIAKVFNTDILPSMTFEMEADQGGEFKTSAGTRIIVPAAAFTDQNGNEVKGKVKIEFEEYHTPAEILASGIPMTCKDASGEIQNFESAGMFSINGTSADKPVKIKKGKSIEVKVASDKPGTYDFFMLDVPGGSWQKLGTPAAEPNVEKTVLLEKLEKETPAKPLEPKKLASNLPLVELKVDYSRQPEFSVFKNVFWELLGTKKEIAKNKDLITSKKWEVALQPNTAADGTYVLELKDKNTKHNVSVLPVLLGQDLEKARQSFAAKLEAYNNKVVLQKDEQSRLQAEGDLLRGFAVNSFGIYNCDRFYNAPAAIKVTPSFAFDRETYNPDNITIFLIAGDAVIRYSANSQFTFAPSEKNRLVAILPGNELAVMTNREFSALDQDEIRKTGKATFKLRSTGRKIDKVADLNELVASL